MDPSLVDSDTQVYVFITLEDKRCSGEEKGMVKTTLIEVHMEYKGYFNV
jgi:hypothetical protein